MRDLIRYAAEIPQLHELTSRVAEVRATQGVFVEPHPAWQLYWACLHAGLPDRDTTANLAYHLATQLLTLPDAMNYRPLLQGIGYPFVRNPEFNFHWFPDSVRKKLGIQFPLLVSVHICEERAGQGRFGEERESVFRIVREFEESFAVEVSERKLAVLAANPGDRVHGASPGTIGGYLEDASGSIFGTSCAHVAPIGTPVTDHAGAQLGTVTDATPLSRSPSGQLCNARSTSLNELDASIFPVGGNVPRSGCVGPTAHYGSSQVVQMRGGTSLGPHTYYLGGVGMIQTLRHNGVDHCYKNLFCVKTRPTAPFPLPIAVAMAPSPEQGDSGAWVHSTGPYPQWIGTIVGVDQFDGFASDAVDTLAWASNTTGQALIVR